MIREEIYEKYMDEKVMKQVPMEKYCSAKHGDPYPPCYNPAHKCIHCYENQLKTGHWLGEDQERIV